MSLIRGIRALKPLLQVARAAFHLLENANGRDIKVCIFKGLRVVVDMVYMLTVSQPRYSQSTWVRTDASPRTAHLSIDSTRPVTTERQINNNSMLLEEFLQVALSIREVRHGNALEHMINTER